MCLAALLSYLPLVDNMSYGTDHAGSARTKHLFDPLLLESRVQLAHGQVALCHLKLTLREAKCPFRKVMCVDLFL